MTERSSPCHRSGVSTPTADILLSRPSAMAEFITRWVAQRPISDTSRAVSWPSMRFIEFLASSLRATSTARSAISGSSSSGGPPGGLSLIHISEPTRLGMISYAVFCLKKKKHQKKQQTVKSHTNTTDQTRHTTEDQL